MIGKSELEEKLKAYVHLRGMLPEQERVALACVKAIAPDVYKLIRHEVLQATREAFSRSLEP